MENDHIVRDNGELHRLEWQCWSERGIGKTWYATNSFLYARPRADFEAVLGDWSLGNKQLLSCSQTVGCDSAQSEGKG
jgi:hypothetical protein